MSSRAARDNLSNGVNERHGAKSLTERNSAERLMASVIWNREDPRFLDIVYAFFFAGYSVVC